MFPLFSWPNWPSFAPTNLNQSILPGWSLLTVNENNSSAPDTERRIVAQDSYGRQIGQTMEVVDLLLKIAEASNPSLKDNKEVEKFNALKERIAKAKESAQEARQEQLVTDLLVLKAKDEARFNTVISLVT